MRSRTANKRALKAYHFILKMLRRRKVSLSLYKSQSLSKFVNNRLCIQDGGSVYLHEIQRMGPGYVGKILSCALCRREQCRFRNRFLLIVPHNKKLRKISEKLRLIVRIKKASDSVVYGIFPPDVIKNMEEIADRVVTRQPETITGRARFYQANTANNLTIDGTDWTTFLNTNMRGNDPG